ncbi:MAG: phosphomannomutase/phosphoglucomutase [Candidatus Eremiobacteraeota bacterium]|nr:phosphomannomutase/phosphoglucomutase [Candidatus Eremiobacteraeota bacterium]
MKLDVNKTVDLFKRYDIRGTVPYELTRDFVYQVGRAFVARFDLPNVVIGRDMRESGQALFEALAEGVTDQGASATYIGMVSTDALYFATGKFGYDGGVMITASHNPANYNGLKFCLKDAVAVSLETGLGDMRDQIIAGTIPSSAKRGSSSERNILEDFAQHCLSMVDQHTIKPFKIAVDAGNGMGGLTTPIVFKHLPCEIVPLFFELDGSFPNHPANPMDPANKVQLQDAVRKHGCDLGATFDGDADRMFIVDEKAGLVDGGIMTALIGLNTLNRFPGSKILYNLICSRSVPEVIARAGCIPVRSPVGHSIIKPIMREQNIPFGGEHSGHYYFRENWFADSGMIALLHCLELLSRSSKTISELIAPIDTRFRSGEINSKVAYVKKALDAVESFYAKQGAQIDHLDGVTVDMKDWWLNVRPSNTEPLLRLNVEGDTKSLMQQHRDEALSLIASTVGKT